MFGKIQQGRAAKQAADYNATIARQNAETTKQQTQAALDKQDRERRLRLGANIAASGASGVGMESFGDIMASSAMQEELDMLTIESEGLLRSRDFEAQANMYDVQGRNAMSQAIIGAGSSVLGGVSDKLGSNKAPKDTINWTDGTKTRIY
jgi:hypothetical protein